MPTYEYQCRACGHQLEAFQKMSDDPLKDCPECHKGELQRLISASGFQLKGTGWYATDFRTNNKSDSGASKESSSNTDTTSKKTDSGSSTSES